MFEKYLTEAKKEYKFSIGVAGELPEGFPDKMETALQKFSVVSMGAGKKTPIQERPLDFPQLNNCEVTYYEVTMSYPTTPQVLEEYIPQCCDVDRAMVVVRTENDPGLEYQDAKDENPYETKLEKEDMGQAEPDSQKQVGGERIMELLKELESARKEKENDPIADVKPAKTDDISDSIGTTSAIGSK